VLCWRSDYSNDGKYEQPCRLPEAADNEWEPASKPLNQVETGEGHKDVDCAKDELRLNWVLDTCSLKNGCTVLGLVSGVVLRIVRG
jgi:hypothetical protein